jgi:tetratricopeptide (TPR) repeat protein
VVFLLRATGRLREALAVAEQALATSEGKPDWGLRTMGHRVATLLLHRRGALLCDTGRAAEGLEAMEQAAGLAREQDDRQILCWQLHDRIWLAELLGPTRGLGELADEALAIAERRGSDSMLAQAFAARGAALRIGGRFEEAAPAFEQALAISSEHGAARVYDPQCLAALAEARCAAGDAAGAEAALDRALASAAALGSPSQEIRAQAARVRIRLGAGEAGLADAAEALARAAGLAAAIDAAGWEPTLAELRAALSAARGDGAARDAELARAAALWHAMGDPERAASAASEPIRALGA